MDYEKKYKDALADIQELYNSMKYMSSTDALHITTALERAFPELRESEDEKISKDIIWCLKHSGIKLDRPINPHVNTTMKDAIAWLEKQGNPKSIWHNDDEEPIKGSLILLIMQSGTPIVAKIIEPNHTFNHGERWAYIDDLLGRKGEQEEPQVYEPNNGEVSTYSETERYKVIEPKFKVGDIITPKDGGHEQWQIMQVDILDKKYRFKDGYVIHFSQEDDYELVEQKPDIEIKTPEESLGIDSETYNKIVDECIYGGQNSSWSEEDENLLKAITYTVIRNSSYKGCMGISNEKMIDWLQSLKDRVQPQWKPENIHLEALRCVINGNNLDVIALKDLLEQLKKL